jgi:SAM-dependent methyltransferase
MNGPNAEQIAEWNGELGRRWVERQRELDAMLEPFSHAALDAAAARAGERVLDVGCGCGATTVELAAAVGAGGRVLGIDVSRPMLEVARARGNGLPQLDYQQADAASATFGAGFDLLFSRFGLMFFDAPAAALGHLRGALRPGGRLVSVCWRAPRDNAWAMTPLAAARRALGVEPPPWDPHAPGPFAFADGERLERLLREAGFDRITLQRCDAPLRLGASAAAAAAYSMRVGPVSRFAREAGPPHEPAIVAAVEQALAPLAGADGSVRLNGSVWLVTAARGG